MATQARKKRKAAKKASTRPLLPGQEGRRGRPIAVKEGRDQILNELFVKDGMILKIADGIGISPQAVGKWNRVPAERVVEVARITRVSKSRLRPDLYPS